ncbi:MAG: DUF3592 domain-containing protein [Pseudomonadota bacterium]
MPADAMLRILLIRLNMTQMFFFRTLPDGRREVSWRVWVLIFLLPGGFLGAAALLTMESLQIVSRYQRTTGEVTHVYAWDGWNPVDGATKVYSPRFRYAFRPGEMTEATGGQSSANWNFAIGSRHEILFDPEVKRDVVLPVFERLWALPVIIAAIGTFLLLPALVAAYFVRRWLRNAVTLGLAGEQVR